VLVITSFSLASVYQGGWPLASPLPHLIFPLAVCSQCTPSWVG